MKLQSIRKNLLAHPLPTPIYTTQPGNTVQNALFTLKLLSVYNMLRSLGVEVEQKVKNFKITDFCIIFVKQKLFLVFFLVKNSDENILNPIISDLFITNDSHLCFIFFCHFQYTEWRPERQLIASCQSKGESEVRPLSGSIIDLHFIPCLSFFKHYPFPVGNTQT